jgi:hypothetical protein
LATEIPEPGASGPALDASRPRPHNSRLAKGATVAPGLGIDPEPAGPPEPTMSETDPEVRVVLCTCPSDHADRIARTVVEERLVACVNVVSGVKSLYWWKGELQDDSETLLVIKTPTSQYAKL